MAKFIISYEVEAIDQNAATSAAHEILFLAGMDVDKVVVHPKRVKPVTVVRSTVAAPARVEYFDTAENFDEF